MNSNAHFLGLLEEGLKAQKAGDYDQALHHYQTALRMDERNLALLLQLAQLYQLLAQPQRALKLYHQALQIEPGSAYLHYQLGVHFLKTQAFHYAQVQFKNVLAIDPEHQDAYFHLGVSYFHSQQYREAEECFETTIKENPEAVEAWVNLGAIALAEQHSQLAISRFTQALILNPEHEAARSNLAAAFMHFNRFENALTHYLILLEHFPEHREYLYQAAVAEMTLGQNGQAQQRFLKLLTQQPDDFSVLYNLAVLLLRSNQKQEARIYLARALDVKPDDASCRYLMAALTGGAVSSTDAQIHAHRLFDQYAMYYDQHMLKTLQYRLPAMMMALLKKHVRIDGSSKQTTEYASDDWVSKSFPFTKILDLGCGTGLCGELLQDLCEQLVGLDLSEEMLTRAQEKKCYELCIQADAVHFLTHTEHRFDLIVALELFPYMGDLRLCFEGMERCLSSSGYGIFSVEVSESPGFYLQETARYAHHRDYIEALCQQMGMRVIESDMKVARQQDGTGSKVWLFLVQSSVAARANPLSST